MQSATCAACGQQFNKGDTFQVLDRTLCGPCGDEFVRNLSEQQTIEEGGVVRNLDATVCVWCNADFGDEPLSLLVADLPTCDACNRRMRNWPYPMWVKASFATIVIVALAALIWNWRFLDAAIAFRQIERALSNKDVPRTASLMERAAADIPEDKALGDRARLYRGIAFLSEDNMPAALPHLQHAAIAMPNDSAIQAMLSTARVGIAYDAKDYHVMVSEAKIGRDAAPGEWRLTMALASALACRYADQGRDADRVESLAQLEKASEMARGNTEAAQYDDRIRFRLATREIIDKSEFAKRFPNGWKKQHPAETAP